MDKNVISIQMEWAYSPSSYLEGLVPLECEGYTLQIDNGKAIANVEPSFYEVNKDIDNVLTKKIENYFLATQLFTHKSFTLSKPMRTDVLVSGERVRYHQLNALLNIVVSLKEDLIIKGQGGNIILDTKIESLSKCQWLAKAINQYRETDITLDHMLQSYKNSVDDHANELVHLYEIREVLSKCFGSKKSAIKKLQIKKGTWKIIGDLANAPILKQGRHRGGAAGQLRPASEEELSKARSAAKKLIESYLQYLENTSNASNVDVKHLD